ncbi:hypothetical protein B7R22_02480 [Subtercola boreus]|uniref:Dehydrogenase n=1 Tax=Subtercola boreus TaxID=120213 RepID=A0A3E0W437_9MICO|nr:Gfo/Idh/MocA family oxidoreductase [Subtercola boreus]RFA16741.1 hypothetical protein B7R22_02480 [Subtercola boreus]
MIEALTEPDYLPLEVDVSRHRIALIGCGGISAKHLAAYRAAGFIVSVLADRTLAKAEARRDEFFPDADVTDVIEEIFANPSISIVDIATHVDGRPDLVRRALLSGKDVLSQKPFVRDLVEGAELIALADKHSRTLAVNHNARWAPQFSVARAAVERGDIGEVTSADFQVYWPHDRIVEQDAHFSTMHDLILFDFGIHWFDLIAQLMAGAGEAQRVFASTGNCSGQLIPAPTQADVIIEFERARATIVFRASSSRAEAGSYRIEGTDGVITHYGLSLGGETVELETLSGRQSVRLQGDWWSNGMRGTMAELIGAIDDSRTPRNSALSSLEGLALCFAAQQSAATGLAVDPRTVNRAPSDDE